jgi:NAD(P)-dependent dehydrogenase (short-subunit alcohol dehydrogenase family)
VSAPAGAEFTASRTARDEDDAKKMQDLSRKAAFITGGASGIGRAIAESMVREGVSVAIADIDADAAAKTCAEIEASGGRAVPLSCDVTQEKSVAQAADEATAALGEIQLLVNNAGAFMLAGLEDTTRSDWEWLLEVNVLGVVNGLQTFLPRMRAQDAPCHIVNTASVSGHIPTPGLSIYTASKFAVVGLTESLRVELAGSAIGLSLLCPGIVSTGLLDSSRKHRATRFGASAEGESPMRPVIAQGSDPAVLGDQVVEAVKAGEFYIFTHSGIRPAFEKRFNEILSAYRGD